MCSVCAQSKFLSGAATHCAEGGNAFNHTFNVRLKEPYDENLKRLNEFMDKTFPQVALTFHTVDDMLSEILKMYIVSAILSLSLPVLSCL